MTATSSPQGPRRTGGLVLLARVVGVLGVLALIAGALVAVCTRVDADVRLVQTLAAVGSWAWVAMLVALVLLGVAVLSSPRRRVWVAALLVAVLGLVTQVVVLAPRFVGDRVAGEAGPTVMTANLKLGNGDAESVVREVRERRVDLLATEETTVDELARLRAAGLMRVLPYAAGTARTDAAGTMMFSRAPLAGETPVPVSLGGVRAQVRSDGVSFTFVAVHLRDPLFYTPVWYADLERLQRTVRALRAGGQRVVVAGDFNTTPDHAPFRRLLARTGLRDGAEQAGSGLVPTWPADRLTRFLTIDHVLTGAGLAVTRTTRVRVPGSDHSALVARLEKESA